MMSKPPLRHANLQHNLARPITLAAGSKLDTLHDATDVRS